MLRPKQIRISELFTVQRILASRGFAITSEGKGLDTIIPRSTWESVEAELVFNIFNDSALRQELLSHIETGENLQSVDTKKLKSVQDVNLERQAFSTTFEWYVGELLRRKFGAFSSSYGVTVENILRNSGRL